ncbi:MAG: thiolase family protein [Anaerolineae bacterium]|nr:MAG: thiolase family protein [Anaerolineae bacterium]
MRHENAFIPYGGYWSTPFCKWQGSFAVLHPITFAAEVTRRALAERELEAGEFDGLYLGMTVPSRSSFYGAPWLAGLIGAEGITGPTISQACATSARVIGSAAYEVEANAANGSMPALLCITADRTSNGPHMVYPNPLAPGGKPEIEDWVWDNFNLDPFACNAMIETAENVARERKIETQAQHEVVLMRYEQYQAALEDDGAFHRSFMVSPVEVNPTGRRVVAEVTTDEGIFPTTAAALDKLKPVLPDGTVTYGGQTYPADGNAGMVVTGKERAAEMSRNSSIEIQLLAFGQGRAKPGFMPEANLPAAARALEVAGIEVADLAAIKTHNPFAVNDICLSNSFGIPLEKMNNYGCSLIWGHPQGPTGMRLVIELIEELVRLGGGYGLFTGCAAGDTAGALVLKVSAAK